VTYTVAELEAFLLREGVEGLDGWDATEKACACAAAGAWVDQQSGREFSTVTEERLFTGNDALEVLLPEFVSVSAVTVNGTATDSALYQPLPLNNSPKLKLRRTSGVWSKPSTQALGNLGITAAWGYAATRPAEVLRAAGHVAAAQALSGGTIPDPTSADLKTVSAFSLSYTLANTDGNENPAVSIVAVAKGILLPYVDITARLARLG